MIGALCLIAALIIFSFSYRQFVKGRNVPITEEHKFHLSFMAKKHPFGYALLLFSFGLMLLMTGGYFLYPNMSSENILLFKILVYLFVSLLIISAVFYHTLFSKHYAWILSLYKYLRDKLKFK